MENLRQEKGQGAGHAPSGEPVIKGAAQLASTINQSELAAAMHFLGQTLGAASHYDPSRPDHGRASVVAALVGVNQLIAALFPNKPAFAGAAHRSGVCTEGFGWGDRWAATAARRD